MGRPRKDASETEVMDMKEAQLAIPEADDSIGNTVVEPIVFEGYMLGIMETKEGQFYLVQAEANLKGEMGNFKIITDEPNEGRELARERFKIEASNKILTMS